MAKYLAVKRDAPLVQHVGSLCVCCADAGDHPSVLQANVTLVGSKHCPRVPSVKRTTVGNEDYMMVEGGCPNPGP